jgi:hypothetical protein
MPPKKKTDTPKDKGTDLFEFLDGITVNQKVEYFDGLTDTDKKKYKNSRYMLHRFLSMNVSYSQVVNELQKYPGIPDRCHYLFLTNMLPRGKQYNKYVKGSRETKYEKWLVDLITKHFHVSSVEAIQYLEIYYTQNKTALRELCELYGIDKKQIKGAKL